MGGEDVEKELQFHCKGNVTARPLGPMRSVVIENARSLDPKVKVTYRVGEKLRQYELGSIRETMVD